MKNLILIFTFLITCTIAYSQGCSDAGFCTLDANSPNSLETDLSNASSASLGLSYGLADNDITAVSSYIKYKRQINSAISIETKLTSITQSGSNISNSGLSDIFLNLSYKNNSSTSFSGGLKIPLSDANKMYDELKNQPSTLVLVPNYSLPLDYQSSLGTFDLLLAASHQLNNFQLNVALQQPLTQSENGYIYGDGGNTIQTTNGFERKGDGLVRISYPLELNDKISLTPSLLNIYHFGNDTYLENNERKDIEGSDGLTVNVTAFLDYKLSSKSNIMVNMGTPLVVREIRPDGLTRAFVAGLEYRVYF